MDSTIALLLTVMGLTAARHVMTPNRRSAVLKMCSIALDARRKCKVSRRELALQSGIRRYRRDVTVAEVAACLARRPDLIEQWEIDIADRRGPGGYAYGKTDTGYRLSEVGEGMVSIPLAHFTSRAEVCAVFALLCTARYLEIEMPAAQAALRPLPIH